MHLEVKSIDWKQDKAFKETFSHIHFTVQSIPNVTQGWESEKYPKSVTYYLNIPKHYILISSKFSKQVLLSLLVGKNYHSKKDRSAGLFSSGDGLL